MLVRALTFDGFIEDPDWVYRWRDHEWGATGVAHFYRDAGHGSGGLRPGEPVDRSVAVLMHILDRLGIRPELRRAWCISHADEPIIHEFRGVWPRSVSREVRTRRVIPVRVREMWDPGPFAAVAGLTRPV